MKTYQAAARLLLKYQINSLTEQERQTLQKWINRSERNRQIFIRFTDKAYWEKLEQIDLEKEWQKVIAPRSVEKVNKSTRMIYRYIAAACIITLLIGVGFYKFFSKEDIQNSTAKFPLLQLAGQAPVELNNALRGPLARTFGQEVSNKNREIRFDPIVNSNHFVFNKFYYTEPFYNNSNTIITPKGCIYFIILPDGSKVALNECSAIQFPSRFDPEERIVEVSGEAYFEVKPHYNGITGKKIPFIVVLKKMKIGVVGTEFNVTSYNDGDSVKTTLVKGSVTLKTDFRECTLEPGKAIVLNKGEFSAPVAANLDEVKAWRAVASFDNAPIEDIMEHISRVFGVTVTYKNKTSMRFTVDIPETGSLVKALEWIENTKMVKCRIDGKNVIVEFINQ